MISRVEYVSIIGIIHYPILTNMNVYSLNVWIVSIYSK